MVSRRVCSCFLPFLLSVALHAAETKVLTNHLGYDPAGPKHAVVLGKESDAVSACALKNYAGDRTALTIPARAVGAVKKWRDWYFWTVDFDSFTTEGKYYLDCQTKAGSVPSFPFQIQKMILERNTISDAINYFKAERSAGRMDQADRHLSFDGKAGTLDAHGGWWDATGDYGKHLSHLSFSTYFNPQQIPLVAYSLFKSYELMNARAVPSLRATRRGPR